MRAEVLEELRQVMHDASDAYYGDVVVEDDPSTALRWCSFARSYVLDRWHRFHRFGVESRDDLMGIVVTVKWTSGEDMPEWGGAMPTFSTTVSVDGTVLGK